MATAAPEVKSSYDYLQFIDVYSGSPQGAVFAPIQEGGDLYESPKAALGCAKGAIMAIGLEIGAVLCICGIGLLWRLFQ